MKHLICSFLSTLLALSTSLGILAPVQAQDEPGVILNCAFGYNSNDSVAPSFIDILTSGTPVDFTSGGVIPDDQVRGPFPVGFNVRFFENEYTEFYVSTNGFIAFGEEPPAAAYHSNIPVDFIPNNMIAPFWDDLTVGGAYNDGAVYYQSFPGPNPYLVVQWYRVTRYGESDEINFEIVLYANGNIALNYGAMNGTLNESTIGIEDIDGVDGIQNYYNAPGIQSDMSIAYTYPSDGPRVKIVPANMGLFFNGGIAVFNIELLNTGTISETFNLEMAVVEGNAFGEMVYLDASGSALVDTTGDGIVDTGLLDPLVRIPIRVEVAQASGAAVGDYAHLELTGRAISQSDKSFTTRLSAAVPAPFAQALTGPADGIKIQFVTPHDNFERLVYDYFTGKSLTVVEVANHFYFFAWEHQYIKFIPPDRFLAYANIEYTLVSTLASLPMTVRVIENNFSTVTEFSVKDRSPVFLRAPRTGRIGALFIQEESNDALQIRANVWFTVLDAQGNPVGSLPPRRVTDNEGWFQPGGEPGVPHFGSPSLAVVKDETTQKDLFVLIWQQRTMVNVTSDTNDIWMAVYNESGNPVLAPFKLTNSTPGGDRFYRPAVVSTNGDQFLLTYTTLNHLTQTYEVSYAVFDRTGSVIVPAQSFSDSNGVGLDVTRLSDDRLLLAWTNYDTLRISFAVLDSVANVIHPPTDLESPDLRGMNYVSVTHHTDFTGENHYGILTWGDDDWSQYLYYALVSQEGELLTPPLAFRRGSDPVDPVIFSSYTGGGNDRLVYPIPWGIFIPAAYRSN